MSGDTPIFRALKMTGIFIGPGFLILFFLSAFFGAVGMSQTDREALRASHPSSFVISLNSGSENADETYLLVPASFQHWNFYSVDPDTGTTEEARSAFSIWFAILVAAILLTFVVSLPYLMRLYGSRPEVATEDDSTNDHAQL